jgi:hypothetical protein
MMYRISDRLSRMSIDAKTGSRAGTPLSNSGMTWLFAPSAATRSAAPTSLAARALVRRGRAALLKFAMGQADVSVHDRRAIGEGGRRPAEAGG